MSALGQKRTFAPQKVMSALPPKADIRRYDLNVGNGSKSRHSLTTPLAAEQRRKIGDCLHDCGRLEAEFLGNLCGTALNPERVQPGRRGAIDVPGIGRDEAKLGVGDLQPLGGQIVDPRADLVDLDFLDADNIIEKIADSCALSRRLQHFWLAVRQGGELNSLLLWRLKTWLHVREGGEAQ